MLRLTEKDGKGNWGLKGVTWEDLKIGKPITEEVWEKLYGALCKLKDYEDTDLPPEKIYVIDGLYAEKCKELAQARKARQPETAQVGKVKRIKLFAPHTEVRIYVTEQMEKDLFECEKMLIECDETKDCDNCSWKDCKIADTDLCDWIMTAMKEQSAKSKQDTDKKQEGRKWQDKIMDRFMRQM